MATKKTNIQQPDQFGINPNLITVQGRVMGNADKSAQMRIGGMPSDADMVLINKLSRSGNVKPESVYVFDCVPSTQNVDSYFTRMDTTSLINYANESKAGVPLMNSHRKGSSFKQSELPIGRSFNGIVANDPDNSGQQLFYSDAYMLRANMANGSVNTDDIIAAIEAGTVSDISIGFYFTAGTAANNFADRTILRCSICGNDFLASGWGDGPDDCPHWPGELYKSEGGNKTDLCVLDVVNAHLSEYSTVYDGASPGAVILKAQRAASEGLLDRMMIHRLEDTYRVRLMDYATFPVPVIEVSQAKKEKAEGSENPLDLNIDHATGRITATSNGLSKIEETPNAERIDDEMAVNSKRELEDASKEGAKLALANLAKSLMGSRSFSEYELALFPEIETRLAAGEVEQAQELLTRLMALSGGEVDENGNIRMGGFVQTEGWRVAGQDLPEGTQDDTSNPGTIQPVAVRSTEIVSLSMSANERQQFQALKEENARLKADNKRLVPLATTGERYREVLLEQTARQAVRADMGSETDTLDMLQHLPIEHIERIYSQYKQLGDNRLGQHDQDEQGNLILTGMGGRQTTPANPNQPNFSQALNVAAQRAGVNAKRNDLKAYR